MEPMALRTMHYPCVEPCEPRRMLATYYISPTGLDSNAGTSAAAPWKSIARINQRDLNAGDRVLLQGGATFATPAPSSTNLVLDGGFESGNFGAWAKSLDATAGNTTFTTSAADVHGGTRAIRVGGSTAGGRRRTSRRGVKPDRSYQLKFWGKHSAGLAQGPLVGITFYDGDKVVDTRLTRVTSSSYRQYTIGAIAPDRFTRAGGLVHQERRHERAARRRFHAQRDLRHDHPRRARFRHADGARHHRLLRHRPRDDQGGRRLRPVRAERRRRCGSRT